MQRDDDMDKLLDEFASIDEVRSAMHEKTAGQEADLPSSGELTKDYPQPQRNLDLHEKTGEN